MIFAIVLYLPLVFVCCQLSVYHGLKIILMTDRRPQRIAPGYGDDLVAVQQLDSTIVVLFARLCDNLGLRRASYVRRVQSHMVLNEGLVTLTIQTSGGPQEAQCLRLDLIPLWLSGVQTARQSRYSAAASALPSGAAGVLWQAFKPHLVLEERPATEESTLAIAQLEQIVEQSKAMQCMADDGKALSPCTLCAIGHICPSTWPLPHPTRAGRDLAPAARLLRGGDGAGDAG